MVDSCKGCKYYIRTLDSKLNRCINPEVISYTNEASIRYFGHGTKRAFAEIETSPEYDILNFSCGSTRKLYDPNRTWWDKLFHWRLF